MAQTVLIRTCFSVSGQESKAYFERRVPLMCLQMRRYSCIAERQQSDAAYHILIHALVIHSRWQRVFTAFFVFNLSAMDVRSSSVQPL